MPRYEDICWNGLEEFSREKFNLAMSVNSEDWKKELLSHEEFFSRLYDKLPKEFIFMRELTLSSLWRSPVHWELASER
jgi:phosphoenolpyruvate carboxykinase (GTP)